MGCRAAPVTPGQIPFQLARQFARHGVKTMRAERAAAHDPEKPHPAATPQAMTRNRFIGIFGTGRHMAAGISDQRRQCQLIESDKRRAKHPARRLAPAIGEITAVSLCWRLRISRVVFATGAHWVRRPWLCLRFGECNRQRRRRSKASTRGGLCIRAQARNISGLRIALPVTVRFP